MVIKNTTTHGGTKMLFYICFDINKKSNAELDDLAKRFTKYVMKEAMIQLDDKIYWANMLDVIEEMDKIIDNDEEFYTGIELDIRIWSRIFNSFSVQIQNPIILNLVKNVEIEAGYSYKKYRQRINHKKGTFKKIYDANYSFSGFENELVFKGSKPKDILIRINDDIPAMPYAELYRQMWQEFFNSAFTDIKKKIIEQRDEKEKEEREERIKIMEQRMKERAKQQQDQNLNLCEHEHNLILAKNETEYWEFRFGLREYEKAYYGWENDPQ
jgi:hypothetical protein